MGWAQARTLSAQMKLVYQSVLHNDLKIPAWIDNVLRKAVHPEPGKRYGEFSEFVQDPRQPNRQFLNKYRPPLIERNPLMFWKSLCFVLVVIVIMLCDIKLNIK